MALSATVQSALQEAIDLMLKGQAYETPFSEDVIQRVARAANLSGFMTVGAFYEAARNEPFATLLKFVKYAGA